MNEMIRDEFDEVIHQERVRQGSRYSERHDDSHTISEWADLLEKRVWRIKAARMEHVPKLLVEIAALAHAALESLDRKGHGYRKDNGTHRAP